MEQVNLKVKYARAPAHLGLGSGVKFALVAQQDPRLPGFQMIARDYAPTFFFTRGSDAEAELRELRLAGHSVMGIVELSAAGVHMVGPVTNDIPKSPDEPSNYDDAGSW